ncbi:hypothetical protein CEXT_689871 [Caerostris extrusa]|uniref:Uncharacterized protein n=1 Tax=Caerostris extrusa TaxID=172846 RepID=A0AAV4TA68_CAEEX|nr:hypothetical protein CEXT_689871 [Caerostris extrusa]
MGVPFPLLGNGGIDPGGHMGVGYTLPRIVCSFAAYHTTLIAPNRSSIQMICSTHFENEKNKKGGEERRNVETLFCNFYHNW